MSDNPNAPDPRIGAIGKALDEYTAAVKDMVISKSFAESYDSKFNLQEKRAKLMDLIRKAVKHD
jgi:hypothetical protein